MNGVWHGSYKGSNSGEIVLEIDDLGDHFEGCAYAYDSNPTLPNTFAYIRTSNKETTSQFSAPLLPLDPRTLEPTTWNQICSMYQGSDQIVMPTTADVKCEWADDQLSINWNTNIGTSGSASIPKSRADYPSERTPLEIRTWAKFKEFVRDLKQYKYIFRGQTNTWRLRTPFHRTGRGDMRRFYNIDDIPALHRSLSARTKHFYMLTDPLQYAAFLNLVQHHGYPTPLLDWTFSPYVAAYFSYRIKSSEVKTSGDQSVRIFVFDRTEWCNDFNQVLNVSTRRPHFSLIAPLALGNERLVPQQALSSVTTVDDIETYIAEKEAERKKTYLQVIDLPISERDAVVQELSLMGITAGSLFPGLDGACEELRDRFFKL